MAFDYTLSTSLLSSTSIKIVDSPPSLAFSDISSEDHEESLTMDKEDASSVLAKALGHLNRVAEHLRKKEENEAANEIAKQTIMIVDIFNNATAPWDIEKFLMGPVSVHHTETKYLRENETGQNKTLASGSWAAVAATATGKGNRLVKFRPSDALKRHVMDEKPAIVENDLRVVWVQPWNSKRSLSDVTLQLNHGALLSIAYSEIDQAVCVIFQHAIHAQSFMEDNQESIRRFGHGLFGPQCQALPGQAYSYNDDLRRMDSPMNERRRLTFARQQLFTNGLTENQFKKDIISLVGEDNVELVWLFNTGNATVVFSATIIARMIRDNFLARAQLAGPYKGVQVTFSHDPCERPMNLISQLPSTRNYIRQAIESGSAARGANCTPLGQSDQRPSPCSTPLSDDDGWQTVGKRR